MLTLLHETLLLLPELLKKPELWDSLIINRREPHTYRVWTILPSGVRVCLHKFDPCSTQEAFDHPHPWPGAFMILQGAYEMRVGYSPDRNSPQTHMAKFVLREFSGYEILNPLTWHAVVPLETTYTVMINGEPFPPEIAHTEVRTTKGKDLEKMPPEELAQHLKLFTQLVGNYRSAVTPDLLHEGLLRDMADLAAKAQAESGILHIAGEHIPPPPDWKYESPK